MDRYSLCRLTLKKLLYLIRHQLFMKRLTVKVIPNAKKNDITDQGSQLIVRVTAPPVGGKANKTVIMLLAEYFKVKKRSIRIVQGEKNRKKIIEIDTDGL